MSALPPPIEGSRVRLRPPTVDDVPTLLGWYQDPELVSPFDRYALDSTGGLTASIREAPDDPSSLAPRYVLERRGGGPILGCVGHYRAHPVLAILDVWYLIGNPSARGGGLGTEAVGLLVDSVFRSTAYERVGATCDVENLASARLAEKLGFRREGTLTAGLYHHARWHDVAVFGITRREWAERPRAGTPRDAGPPA